MKDKILAILQKMFIPIDDAYKNAVYPDAAEAITQEMCNAQAKGWWDGNEYYREEMSLINYLIAEGYAVEQAETAIDQLKNKEG